MGVTVSDQIRSNAVDVPNTVSSAPSWWSRLFDTVFAPVVGNAENQVLSDLNDPTTNPSPMPSITFPDQPSSEDGLFAGFGRWLSDTVGSLGTSIGNFFGNLLTVGVVNPLMPVLMVLAVVVVMVAYTSLRVKVSR